MEDSHEEESSFGDYRPYSDSNKTIDMPVENITHRALSVYDTQNDNHNSSSDTANFFQNSPLDDINLENDLQSINENRIPHYDSDLYENYSLSNQVTEFSNIPYYGHSNRYDQYSESEYTDHVEDEPTIRVILDDQEEKKEFKEKVKGSLDDLLKVINLDNEKMKNLKSELKKKKTNIYEEICEVTERMIKERKLWNTNLIKTKNLYDTEIIELCVGGTHKYTTTKSTLCKLKESKLYSLFNNQHNLKTHKGRIFIDRDGKAFGMILSYLRNNKIPFFENKEHAIMFYDEANYWKLPITVPKELYFEFDPLWCASSLKIISPNMIQKNDSRHGIAFCKTPLSARNPYIEFEVSMDSIAHSQRSTLFVGVVDRSKYRISQLLSTFWRDSPSSFYYDVFTFKLMKIDDMGRQTGLKLGYGCECQRANCNLIGMHYDEEKRTLSFYKNGLCLGIGFHNVPKGMYPAVDLWFESGNIEILSRNKPPELEYL